MSKKQLLNESQIRRFMTLANLEPLVKNVLKEGDGQMPEDAPDRRPLRRKEEEATLKEAEEAAADAGGEDAGGGDMVDVDMGGEEGGEADADKTAAFEAAVKALADSLGIEVEMGGEDAGGEDAGDEDAGGEEAASGGTMEETIEEDEMYEGKEEDEMDEGKKREEDDKEEEHEMDESLALSEDSLVEAVLARVTARLVREAKKKKESAKEKMARMKKEKEAAAKKKKALEEAADSKDGGPLLKQGKNKYDPYKGHADMQYAKGKEGKGGHEMETLSAKAEHSVTHGGKNLATLGGSKKK